MPQVELQYSNDIEVDAQSVFKSVEHVLNILDKTAGQCKCRAYPTTEFLHTNAYLRISLLIKPHRDQRFMQVCLEKMKTLLKSCIHEDCCCAVEVCFLSNQYSTFSIKQAHCLIERALFHLPYTS